MQRNRAVPKTCCFNIEHFKYLVYSDVQSCELYKNKYMIALSQITNTEISAFMAVLVFKLLSRKVLFKNRKKTIETVKK